MGARRVTEAVARSRADRLARLLLASALAASLCARAAPASAGEGASPPEPDLRVPPSASEQELDALAPGDARRVRLLVDLAVRRHADSLQAELQEERERDVGGPADGVDPAVAPQGEPGSAAHATPQADALRAEAVVFALRASEEGPDARELPDALVVGGLDADRIGRGADALRLLGLLLRRHAGSSHVGDAWLALAERHLRTGDLTRARVALDEAERQGRPAVRAWAAMRHAEVSLAVADLPGAVLAIERAVDGGAPRAREVLERVAASVARTGTTDAVRAKLSALLDRAKRLP